MSVALYFTGNNGELKYSSDSYLELIDTSHSVDGNGVFREIDDIPDTWHLDEFVQECTIGSIFVLCENSENSV